MTLQPALHPDLLLIPPLDLPLRLRLANGQYGALRPKPLPDAPRCFSTQVISAEDPANPTGRDVRFINQVHEAVDLAADAGDCVYAAYAGRVVEVQTAPGRGSLAIDHHHGEGLLTRYLHVTDIRVTAGDFVQKGTPIASVSDEPAEPHLHFELWLSLGPFTSAPGDSDLLALDPTRLLYRWEDSPMSTDVELAPSELESLALTRISAVPFLALGLARESRTVFVPLYPPIATHEQVLVDLARDAHAAGRRVRARYRPSAFWGVDVLTELGWAGPR